jgi:hypothetical protein
VLCPGATVDRRASKNPLCGHAKQNACPGPTGRGSIALTEAEILHFPTRDISSSCRPEIDSPAHRPDGSPCLVTAGRLAPALRRRRPQRTAAGSRPERVLRQQPTGCPWPSNSVAGAVDILRITIRRHSARPAMAHAHAGYNRGEGPRGAVVARSGVSAARPSW